MASTDLTRYSYGEATSVDTNDCHYQVPADMWGWKYRTLYGTERHTRELIKSPYINDERFDGSHSLNRTHYLLDAFKRQLAVYQGLSTSNHLCSGPGTKSWWWAAEYNVYDATGQHLVTMKPQGNVVLPQYRISDYLGNTRLVLGPGGQLLDTTSYQPFGAIWTGGDRSRLGYIGKEIDGESALGDYGARKYDPELGRFMSVDPLWEKFRSLSAYNYSNNNPMTLKDPSGREFVFVNVPDDDDGRQFIADFWSVIDYFINAQIPTVSLALQEMRDNRNHKIAIEYLKPMAVAKGAEMLYNSRDKRIDWSNKQGLELGCDVQSPAVGLVHELGHAWQHIILGDKLYRFIKSSSALTAEPGTTNLLEVSVIAEFETPAAIAIGDPVRVKHSQGESTTVDNVWGGSAPTPSHLGGTQMKSVPCGGVTGDGRPKDRSGGKSPYQTKDWLEW